MKIFSLKFIIIYLIFFMFDFALFAQEPYSPEKSSPPDKTNPWVQPAQQKSSMPVWGHANGVRVGIHPMPGPRGLLRIYAPHLGHRGERVINFIAVEPVVSGQEARGFSELEMSHLDHVTGKRFWSADSPKYISPKNPKYPAKGVVQEQDGVQTLTIYIMVEPFQNGARVYLRLKFRQDRPYELGLAVFTTKDSRKLEYCILTATMGNYARLRRIYLKDSTPCSLELWHDFTGENFTPHASFPMSDMFQNKKGHLLFIAAPDEENPENAEYAPGTYYWWKYKGKKATQYWRCEKPHPELVGTVNGRYMYWNSRFPIPGGVSFENFELKQPFQNGAEYWFGVSPLSPEEFLEKEELSVKKTGDR